MKDQELQEVVEDLISRNVSPALHVSILYSYYFPHVEYEW